MIASISPANGRLEPAVGGVVPQAARPNKPGVQVQEATLADAQTIADVGRQVFEASFGHSVQAEDLAAYFSTSYTAEAFEKELRDPTISTWIARDDDGGAGTGMLGFAQLCRGATDPCLEKRGEDRATLAQLHRLYVDTNAHGRGIGTRLIARAADTARAEGFRKLWLTVWEHNPGAQRLYERQGFVKVDKTSFFVGQEEQWDWVMIKELEQ